MRVGISNLKEIGDEAVQTNVEEHETLDLINFIDEAKQLVPKQGSIEGNLFGLMAVVTQGVIEVSVVYALNVLMTTKLP